jgi:hypothetical protein
MKLGEPGDRLSLARVFGAMIAGGVLLGLVGYIFDLVVGPLIGMGGWWTVFASGGVILGTMIQVNREYAVPAPAERAVVEMRMRAREATESTPEPSESNS